MPSGCQDSHITILPEFTVPAGRMAEFQGGFPKFYKATKVRCLPVFYQC